MTEPLLTRVPIPEPVTERVGGLVRRSYRIPAGLVIFTHTHPYDHLSVLYSGRCDLYKNGRYAETLTGPRAVFIGKGVSHEIFAITDCLWDCIHAFDEAKAAHDAGDPYALLGVKD